MIILTVFKVLAGVPYVFEFSYIFKSMELKMKSFHLAVDFNQSFHQNENLSQEYYRKRLSAKGTLTFKKNRKQKTPLNKKHLF